MGFRLRVSDLERVRSAEEASESDILVRAHANRRGDIKGQASGVPSPPRPPDGMVW